MNTIQLKGNKSMFHKLTVLEQRLEGSYNVGKAILTGYYKGEMNEGDEINFDYIVEQNHIITKVMQRRDHRGKFQDPEFSKNSFFEVETTFKNLKR